MRIAFLGAAAMMVCPAFAGDDAPRLCYEGVGCVQEHKIYPRDAEKLGCDQLWTVRNGIFAARRYCFSTQPGIDEFGN